MRKVLGFKARRASPARPVGALGGWDYATGFGSVRSHECDYHDTIDNRKSHVALLCVTPRHSSTPSRAVARPPQIWPPVCCSTRVPPVSLGNSYSTV